MQATIEADKLDLVLPLLSLYAEICLQRLYHTDGTKKEGASLAASKSIPRR